MFHLRVGLSYPAVSTITMCPWGPAAPVVAVPDHDLAGRWQPRGGCCRSSVVPDDRAQARCYLGPEILGRARRTLAPAPAA